MRTVLLATLIVLGLQQLASAGIIHAKAWLAPVLIERAWQRTLHGGGAVKPWPWADTWPVARLQASAGDADLLVLAGDSGHALAFGPGHAPASARLGTAGLAVVGGHRETHFAFLEQLAPGDPLKLQVPDGSWREYRVSTARVADAGREKVQAVPDTERLLLVTCYPFDAVRPGGSLRYVVEARPDTPLLEPAYTRRVRLL